MWLTYSDSERARYLRKHGHGRAWRHAFEVLDVKPHAVLLDVPDDSSVPDVLPWQSLRKCSFAAPHFHRDDLPQPNIDDRGHIIVEPEDEDRRDSPSHPSDEIPVMPARPVDPMGWDTWTPQREYRIERIVSASKIGGGWRLMVKWEGYPDPTPEGLQRILKQVRGEPSILADIERCKADYIALHPERSSDPPIRDESSEPTLVRPQRDKHRPDYFEFCYDECNQDALYAVITATRRLNAARLSLGG